MPKRIDDLDTVERPRSKQKPTTLSCKGSSEQLQGPKSIGALSNCTSPLQISTPHYKERFSLPTIVGLSTCMSNIRSEKSRSASHTVIRGDFNYTPTPYSDKVHPRAGFLCKEFQVAWLRGRGGHQNWMLTHIASIATLLH